MSGAIWKGFDIHNRNRRGQYRRYRMDDPNFHPFTYAHMIEEYIRHPEAKSLGPDGKPCTAETRGLLQRAHITAGRIRYIDKETSSMWAQGDDLSVVTDIDEIGFRVIEYGRNRKVTLPDSVKHEIERGGTTRPPTQGNWTAHYRKSAVRASPSKFLHENSGRNGAIQGRACAEVTNSSTTESRGDSMPHKDPEREKEWERIHRAERLARRRELRRIGSRPIDAPQVEPQRNAPKVEVAGLAVLFPVIAGSVFAAAHSPRAGIAVGGLTLVSAVVFKKSQAWWLVGCVTLLVALFFYWRDHQTLETASAKTM